MRCGVVIRPELGLTWTGKIIRSLGSGASQAQRVRYEARASGGPLLYRMAWTECMYEYEYEYEYWTRVLDRCDDKESPSTKDRPEVFSGVFPQSSIRACHISQGKCINEPESMRTNIPP